MTVRALRMSKTFSKRSADDKILVQDARRRRQSRRSSRDESQRNCAFQYAFGCSRNRGTLRTGFGWPVSWNPDGKTSRCTARRSEVRPSATRSDRWPAQTTMKCFRKRARESSQRVGEFLNRDEKARQVGSNVAVTLTTVLLDAPGRKTIHQTNFVPGGQAVNWPSLSGRSVETSPGKREAGEGPERGR